MCLGQGRELRPIKTHEPIYQNPFDLGSGGATITRATQEGVFFSNPSLSAFGGGFHRWFYIRPTVHVGADAVDAFQNILSGQASTGEDLLSNLKKPLHGCADASVGYLNSLVGVNAFATTRVDADFRTFGSQGVPEMRLRAHFYTGGIISGSLPVDDWLAVGAAIKNIYGFQYKKAIGLLELQQEGRLNEITNEILTTPIGNGIGFDLGGTLQFRSQYTDLRIGLTLNDVGNTSFQGAEDPWLQTLSGGVGITFHTRSHFIHCSTDYRDILDSYQEHWTKKIYAGCKVGAKPIFFMWASIGAGLYQGYPGLAFAYNLFTFRLETGFYGKEVGSQVGVESRYVYYFTLGFEI